MLTSPAREKIVDIHIDESGPAEGGIFGTEPVMVERDSDCGTCGNVHDIESCPDCGADIILGFGLGMGPGLGEYKVCEKFCGWAWKHSLPHDEC